jgi:uncharacterized heparinase superfamily protein
MARRIGIGEVAAAGLRKSSHRLAVDFGAPLRALNFGTSRIPTFVSLPFPLSVGDVDQGLQILDGQFTLGSQTLDVGTHGDPWSVPAPSQVYANRLHSFNWLDDLASLGSSKKHVRKTPDTPKRTGERARYLVDRWIAVYGKWNPFAWREDILTNRIYSWLTNWRALLDDDKESADAEGRRASLARQLKCLRKTYNHTPPGICRLKAAACLVIAGACLDGKQDGFLDRGLDLLDDELEKQILADGGHISRSAEQALNALEILIQTEEALDARGIAGSKEIRRAIDRMAPIVSFFSTADGHQFSFHGGGRGCPRITKTLLARAKIKPKSFGFARHTKFHKLERSGNTVMIDCGDAAPRPYDLDAHLAPLAMEMSTPTGPLFVNCGWNVGQPEHWRQPMRATAAHSTLILDNRDTGELLETGLSAKLLGAAIAKDAAGVSCARNEQETGTWLEVSHNGYLKSFGLCHRRRLYMDLTGTDIRGEDQLYVPLGEDPLRRDQIPFAIRFHLHPSVKVTLAQDQHSALLIQPGGIGWRFRADGGPLQLEKSVYLAEGCRPRRSEQLVIHGNAYGDSDGQTRSNRVRWTIKRMGNVETTSGPKTNA